MPCVHYAQPWREDAYTMRLFVNKQQLADQIKWQHSEYIPPTTPIHTMKCFNMIWIRKWLCLVYYTVSGMWSDDIKKQGTLQVDQKNFRISKMLSLKVPRHFMRSYWPSILNNIWSQISINIWVLLIVQEIVTNHLCLFSHYYTCW